MGGRETVGVRITVGGTVQGVGFRPFVYRLACRHRITGTVRNTVDGVEVEAFGDANDVQEFCSAMRTQAPPLADIRRFDTVSLRDVRPSQEFAILASVLGDNPSVDLARDTAACDDCVAEMWDPEDRRYRHPLINCTNCGPRYTIIKELPYDRANTTMAGFDMCERCAREYADPASRRFHAQPVCCPECGPTLTLVDAAGKVLRGDPIGRTVELLADGGIVAVKGLGGYHLVCRADSDESVTRLRERKRREEKPLAIMVRDVASAGRYCRVSHDERGLLAGVERPIVLLDKRDGAEGVARSVAPTVTTLGVMLPYTPLHHLLLHTDRYDALVMTSGNISHQPICADDTEAREHLGSIAEAFLRHNRRIHVRIDDSVVRVLGDNPVLLRRARGYVPSPIAVNVPVDGIVALGGIMKSTVCVGRASSCYVSQYLGVADNAAVIDHCSRVLDHLLDVLGVTPQLFVSDMHPGSYVDAMIGDTDIPHLRVQHHHAHAVACLAENRLDGPAVCLVYDGLGMGDDGTVWGGEILVADADSYERVGHLRPVPMPGGDAATKNPGRMALAGLHEALGDEALGAFQWMPDEECQAVLSMLESGINCPLTSSMGRLFDAVSAMLGVCRVQTYEAQPAIELEGVADRTVQDGYASSIDSGDGVILMEGAALLAQVAEDIAAGTAAAVVSARFHNALAAMSAEAAQQAAAMAELDTVALCGGCFQNALLFTRTVSLLQRQGLRVLFHRVLSPGDESISFGQALIAAHRRERGAGVRAWA